MNKAAKEEMLKPRRPLLQQLTSPVYTMSECLNTSLNSSGATREGRPHEAENILIYLISTLKEM